MSLMNLSAVTAHFAELRAIGASLVKEAGDAKKVHALSGKLYLSTSGWLLLSVPNALVRGAFDAMDEIGIELPPQKAGRLNAHVTVMRPEEVEKLGGPDKITERGHNFHYTLGEVKECEPTGWSEMSKCWFIEVSSPELEKLRKSYGLSATPRDGEHEFHITIAVKRKRVTHPGDEVTKQSAEEAEFLERTKAAMPQEMMALGMLDDVLMYHLARWRAHKAKQQVALSQPAPPKPALLEEPKTAAAIDELRNAKALSDKRDYAGKTNILRKLMKEKPDDWAVDSEDKGIAGLTHMPTRFRLHLPSQHIHDLRKGFGTLNKQSSLTGMVGGRLAGTAATKLLRSSRSPLNNYYASMSRAGLEAGFSGGPTIMPRTRWTTTAVLGPAAGTVDYEFGNFIGQAAKNKMKGLRLPVTPALSDVLASAQSVRPVVTPGASGPTVDAPLSRRSRRRIRRQMPPLMRQIGGAIPSNTPADVSAAAAKELNTELKSPLMRNLVTAIATRPTSAATRFAQKNLSSNAKPVLPAAQITASGAATGALHGALSGNPMGGALTGALISGGTDGVFAALANANKTKTISTLKETLLSRGLRASRGEAGLLERATNKGIGALDPLSGEFIDAGRDLSYLSNLGAKVPGRVAKTTNDVIKHIEHEGTLGNAAQAIKKEVPALFRRVKSAGMWDDTPDVVKLPLRGGEQKVCPRCGKPVLHDLYKDRKGWTFHRSCFGKGKGPVGDTEKQAVTSGLVERARSALTARAAAGDAAAAARLAKFEGTRQKWLVGKPMGPRDLPGGHLGRSLTAAGRGDSKSLSELISTLGTAAGTDHKRLAISDELMSGNGLKQLGFRNGSVAVPETGQKGLHNLRHVQNNFHLHPHDGFWTVHEDAHPSIPMAVRKAKGPLSKLKAVGTGSRHVLEEGVPGWYKWVTNTLTGGRPILHAMAAESPNAIIKGTAPREVPGWNPSQLRQFGPTTGLSFGAGALGTAALSDGSK